MAGRDQPRDLENAPDYSYPGGIAPSQSKIGGFDQQSLNSSGQTPLDMTYARNLARQCYESSTNWLNSGRRLKWNDSLRAFQGLHPSGSKYLSTDYKYRSRLFRPKTRTMVRKAEAATAAAFFSNDDVVNITAQDDDNQQQQASAAINQALLQYRLTKTIPWFLTVTGARQDAEVMGICVAKAYWKYKENFSHTEQRPKTDQNGGPMVGDDGVPLTDNFDIYDKVEDHPWVDLTPPENFRADPGADWRNIIASSPYLIELIPVYIGEARAKVKSGEWLPVSESALRGAADLNDDVTRRAREQGRVPGKDNDAWKPTEYDICWVRENILRIDGQDWHFYTLAGGGELLTKPRPLAEVYLQGIRPYVCGFVLMEAHKTYPTSKVELIRDLQSQTNDIGNLRLDNVKLAVNPRQFVKEGQGIDPADVRSFQPAKVVMVKNPEGDIVWDRPPDVTAGAYQEQDRINIDMDDLTGDLSNSSIQANKQMYEAVGNMTMMQGNASQVGEYEQRIFAETFVEPLIKHLVKLEQAYETDPVVLAIAGRDAQLYQKFGMNEITDELLKQELTIKVNVGIGATNPQTRLKNLGTAISMLAEIYGPAAAMATNPPEVIKEIFSLCGYKDGDRFFNPGSDIHSMLQQMAASKAGGKSGAAPGGDPAGDQMKLKTAQLNAQSKLQEAQIESSTDLKIAEIEFQKEQLSEHGQTARAVMQNHHDFFMDAHVKGQQQAQQAQQRAQMHPALAGAAGQRLPQPSGQTGNPEDLGEPETIIKYDKFGNRVRRSGAKALGGMK